MELNETSKDDQLNQSSPRLQYIINNKSKLQLTMHRRYQSNPKPAPLERLQRPALITPTSRVYDLITLKHSQLSRHPQKFHFQDITDSSQSLIKVKDLLADRNMIQQRPVEQRKTKKVNTVIRTSLDKSMLVYAQEIKQREKSTKRKRFVSTGNQPIKLHHQLNFPTSEDEPTHIQSQLHSVKHQNQNDKFQFPDIKNRTMALTQYMGLLKHQTSPQAKFMSNKVSPRSTNY